MSSVGVSSIIAHAAFWLLLLGARLFDELSPRAAVLLALAWLGGFLLLPYVPYGSALFSPLVAITDIALVLAIFKGDVRLH